MQLGPVRPRRLVSGQHAAAAMSLGRSVIVAGAMQPCPSPLSRVQLSLGPCLCCTVVYLSPHSTVTAAAVTSSRHYTLQLLR